MSWCCIQNDCNLPVNISEYLWSPLQEMAGPSFDGVRSASDKAVKDILEMEETCRRFQTLGLPQCLIHGDL
jgi:hypothetical protein